MKVKIDFVGLDPLEKFIKRKLDIEKSIKATVRKDTGTMQERAQRYAPVDTGHLKREINAKITDNQLTGTVSSDAEYAVYQEYGTRYQSGTPHIRPAFNDTKDEFLNNIKRVMKE